MGRKIFLVTVGCVILFLCITIFSALTDIHSDLSWVKESFEWISIYGVPWVIVILLYLILKKTTTDQLTNKDFHQPPSK